MAMTVVIGLQSAVEQTHWSVGRCARCAEVRPVRIGSMVQVLSLYEPAQQLPEALEIGDVVSVRGMAGAAGANAIRPVTSVCQHCGTPTDPFEDARWIRWNEWSAGDGMPSLREKCLAVSPGSAAEERRDRTIVAFLISVEEQSSVAAVDIRRGAFAGGLFGALLGVLGGLITAGWTGELWPLLVAVVAGTGVGVIAGGFAESICTGRKLAQDKICDALRTHSWDPELLQDFSRRRSKRIQRAVARTLAPPQA